MDLSSGGPQSSDSQSGTLGPAAAALPAGLAEMQILGPHPEPTEPETLEAEPSNLCFNKPPEQF